MSQEKRDQLAISAWVKERSKDAVLVEYYRSISPEFALFYGNGFAGRAFARALEARYPHHLFFCIWNANFDTYSDFIDPSTIKQKYQHLYFFGNRVHAYPADQHADLKYFNAKGLSEIDSQGAYVLQEWTRP